MTARAFHCDPCWDAYPDTVIEIGGPAPLRIDLRLPLAPTQREALRNLGLGHWFAVVTACNPRGRRLSRSENESRCGLLHEHIAAERIVSLPADGVSPDGSHREPGLALAIDRHSAIRIAAAYEQSAMFWFDGERFGIVPVLESAAAVDLPLGATTGIHA